MTISKPRWAENSSTSCRIICQQKMCRMRISHLSKPNEKPQHFLQFSSHQLTDSYSAVDHVMIYKMAGIVEAHVSWEGH